MGIDELSTIGVRRRLASVFDSPFLSSLPAALMRAPTLVQHGEVLKGDELNEFVAVHNALPHVNLPAHKFPCDGIHAIAHPLKGVRIPCPYYIITLELTPPEHKQMMSLPAAALALKLKWLS